MRSSGFANGTYEETDSRTLYTMLRYLKPRRMVKVGCGMGSWVTTLAARQNAVEGRSMDVTFVEPFPRIIYLNSPWRAAGDKIDSRCANEPIFAI